ncbi:Rv1733c family protein [Streptomyces halobius]|uniref:Uncharacterized protein n=1 Tax=Streptomyces halobius TaxID=2879846 RepID=A0ABY4MKQ0_9ACTN|nr:hypothetical protein [Streptomyces halobius]UQA97000.1 hypothetical protein K9S39_38615 [Streptomyces halobius]
MALKVILPRWRRGPLRRGTDVTEAWLVLVTGVLIAVAAPVAGVSAANTVSDATERQLQGRHSVSAVLTEDPPARIGVDSSGGSGGRVHAWVRWTAADGSTRTGETVVAPHLKAGDRTTAWLNGHGVLLRDPVSPSAAKAESIAGGTVAASGTTLLLLIGARTGTALLNHRRAVQWEREWAEIDPERGRRRDA